MKFKKNLVVLMLVAAFTASVPFAFTSCELFNPPESSSSSSPSEDSSSSSSPDSSSSEENEPFEQVGAYYCTTAMSEYTLTIDEETCTIVMDGAPMTGEYKFDGTTLTFPFANNATATLDGTIMLVKMGNATYTFFQKVDRVVTFSVDGANQEVTVTNGKGVDKPATPTKAGYWFVGWYADAEYTAAYAFGAPVMTDITVYARFVQQTEGQEFKVNLVVDGEAFAVMETKGGVLYNNELPTPEKDGATFLGWWTSDYDDANKLTAKYDEQKLGEDSTLYAVWASDAPAISVNEKGVSWTSFDGDTYSVKIKDGSGRSVLDDITPETKMAFDFSAREAGDYTVEVSKLGSSKVYTAYYQNKALDKVCYVEASDERVLTFNTVDGAEKYLITIVCGDENHNHTQVEVTKPVYDFASCQMQEGGIKFVVEAVANGYISSTSDEYAFDATLDKVSGLAVNENEIVTWNAVENATYYVVEIIDDGQSLGAKQTTDTSVSLRGLTGVLEVNVYPVARAYNSPETEKMTFNNTRLAIPMNPRLDGMSVVWDKVDGATGYVVTIADKEYTVSTEKLELLDTHFTNNISEMTIRAVCDDATKASLNSDVFKVNAKNEIDPTTLKYEGGKFTWDAVLGASKYGVRVEGGVEHFVTGLSTNVSFNRAGICKVEIRSYNAQGEASAWSHLNVSVYILTLDAVGGVKVDPFYVAEGDSVELPDTRYHGYQFVGWYDIKDGPENNGTKQPTTYIQGKGTTVLYAGYIPNMYAVNLDAGAFGTLEDTQVEVPFSKNYTLPVVKSNEPTKVFAGWFSEPNGQGVQYTTFKGESTSEWLETAERTLYASWYDVFVFQEVGEQNNRGYAVSKNDQGIGFVEDLVIPASYNGLPVTTIGGGAFANCSSLKTISVPDTVQNIFISSDNQVDTGSAFENCTGLRMITVYCADEESGACTHEKFYESDGVGGLLYNNPATGRKEFKFLPQGYQDGDGNEETHVYEIPYGVEVIPTSAFFKSKLTKIIIPASVTQIDSSAFAGCSRLTTLEFVEALAGEAEKELTLASGVFKDCTSLMNLNLPKRVANLNLDIFDKNIQNINITGNAVEGATMVYDSIDGVLVRGSELVYMPKGRTGSYRIPNGIYTIGENAMANCTLLTSVTIPEWVTSIEKRAFYACDTLVDLIFEGTEDSLPLNIETEAFGNSKALKDVTLPANLNKLAAHAFTTTSYTQNKRVTVLGDGANFEAGAFATAKGVYCVSEVYLGVNVQNIEIASVFGTTYLSTVIVDKDNQYLATYENVVYDAAMETLLYYPAARKGEFRIPDGVKTITANALASKPITALYIPASVTTIGDYAAMYNSSLVTLVIEDGDQPLEIGVGAFTRDTGLHEVVIPSRVTKIGAGAFSNVKLEKLTFVDGELPLEIDAYAFKQFSAGSTTNGSAFETATINPSSGALLALQLPTRLRSIGMEAFAGALKKVSDSRLDEANIEIVIPEGVTSIANHAFAKNNAIKSVSLPSTLTHFGAYSDVGALTSILVFDGCAGLQTLTVHEDNANFMVKDGVLYGAVEGVAKELYFSPVSNRATEGVVDVPKTVTKIWDKAFYESAHVHTVTFSEGIEGELSFGLDVFGRCAALKTVNLPVGIKKISEGMFSSCGTLEKVVIPYTVELIEKEAFDSCNKLTTIEFAETPAGVEPVALVFADGTSSTQCVKSCSNLKNINLPERTTKIGAYAFNGAGLISVKIPSTVTEIGDRAFAKCAYMTSFTFAENGNVTAIGDYAFEDCKRLTSIVIPDEITSIGKFAFKGCTGMESVTLNEGLISIGESAFENLNIKGDLVIPATVTTIDKLAFSGCKGVTSVSYGANSVLATIGESAFAKTSISTIVIPATVTSVGKNAYLSCLAATTVTFETTDDGTSALTTVGDYAFASTNLTSATLPETNSQLTLGTSLFDGCRMTNVHIPSKVVDVVGVFDGAIMTGFVTVSEDSQHFSVVEGQKIIFNKAQDAICLIYSELEGEVDLTVYENLASIGQEVFMDQTKITSVKIPYSVMNIDKNAFKGCTALTSVTFETIDGEEQRLAKIGDSAFEGCTALTSITLPENVTELGGNVFKSCTALTSITLNDKISKFGTYVFQDAGDAATSLTVTIPEGIQTIGSYMFYSAAKLTSIVLPSTVKEIGTFAFASSGLAGENPVTFSGTELTKIGANAFNGCKSITKFDVPNSVTSIGDSTFSGCSALTSATLPEGIKKIPNSLFTSTGLVTYEIPDSVTEIGTSAFASTTKLTSVTLPAGLLKIGDKAFNASTALTSVVIPRSVTTIGTSAFEGCSKLATVTFQEAEGDTTVNVAIGNQAFYKCKALKTLTLSKHIKSIGSKAIAGSSATANDGPILTTLEVPVGVTTLGANAFQYCAKLTTAVLGNAKLTSMGVQIFKDCKALKDVTFREGFSSTKLTATTLPFVNCTSTTFKVTLPSTFTTIPDKFFKTNTSTTSAGVNITSIDLTYVTSVGQYAFDGCKKLTTVTGMDGLSVIKEYAFRGCAALTAVDVSKAGTIGNYAFANCTTLKSVVWPTGVVVVPQYCFSGCTVLDTINITNVTTINANAFENCKALKDIDLSKITDLKANAFKGCIALETADLSSLTTSIPSAVFSGCTSLSNVILNDLVTGIGANAFASCTSLTTIKLPANLTMLESAAFTKSGLKEITIPGNVEYLLYGPSSNPANGASATANQFNGCTSLEKVVIEEGVIGLGAGVFKGCTSLTSIKFPSTMTLIGKEALMNTAITYVDLPANLVTLGVNVFSGCAKLQAINISSSNEYFETKGGALYTKQELSKDNYYVDSLMVTPANALIVYPFVNLPEDGVIELPMGCSTIVNGTSTTVSLFSGIAGIKKIVIPESMTHIPKFAFANCADLEEVYIPSTVTTIEGGAFYNCKKISKIVFEDNEGDTPIEFINTSNAIFNTPLLESFTIPKRMVNVPTKLFGDTSSANAANQLKEVIIPEGVESIGDEAFRYTAIESVQLPSTVKHLGKYAFAYTPLKTINLNYIETTGGYTFYSTQLEEVTITANVTWSDYDFSMCKNLTTVNFEEGVTAVGRYLFIGAGLTTVNLSSTVKTIGANAFASNASLTQIDLKNVENIAVAAFKASGLTSVTLPATVTTLMYGASSDADSSNSGSQFRDCTALESVTVLGELKDIGAYTFAGCTALTSFDIPASVELIGYHAFDGSALKKAEIKNPNIRFYASFYNAAALEEVVLPEGLTSLGYRTFYNCSALTTINIPSTVRTFDFTYVSPSTGKTSVSEGGTFGAEDKKGNQIKKLVLPEGIEKLPAETFKYAKALEEINIPESVTYFGKNLFNGCTGIKELVIPKGVLVTDTYSYVFSGWTKGQTVYFCASEAFIGANWAKGWENTAITVVYNYEPQSGDVEA